MKKWNRGDRCPALANSLRLHEGYLQENEILKAQMDKEAEDVLKRELYKRTMRPWAIAWFSSWSINRTNLDRSISQLIHWMKLIENRKSKFMQINRKGYQCHESLTLGVLQRFCPTFGSEVFDKMEQGGGAVPNGAARPPELV